MFVYILGSRMAVLTDFCLLFLLGMLLERLFAVGKIRLVHASPLQRAHTRVFDTWFLGRPEIADFGVWAAPAAQKTIPTDTGPFFQRYEQTVVHTLVSYLLFSVLVVDFSLVSYLGFILGFAPWFHTLVS